MIRKARISDCGTYRYWLYREWDRGRAGSVLWVMLNPSTADHRIDDPTIRRVIGFSKAWGFGSAWVGNLYAYRSTDPKALGSLSAAVAQGPDNLECLRILASMCRFTVCGWGSLGAPTPATLDAIRGPGGLRCLGVTSSGQPRHPLYLKTETPLVEWPRTLVDSDSPRQV